MLQRGRYSVLEPYCVPDAVVGTLPSLSYPILSKVYVDKDIRMIYLATSVPEVRPTSASV